MKILIFLLALSASVTAQDKVFIEFEEEVIVFFEYQTKRGTKMVERYAGKSADIGPFIAEITGPCEFLVVTISDDKDHILKFNKALNSGHPFRLNWTRGDWIVGHNLRDGLILKNL